MTKPQTQSAPEPSTTDVAVPRGVNRPVTAHESRPPTVPVQLALNSVLSFCVHHQPTKPRTDFDKLRAAFFSGHTTPSSSIAHQSVVRLARKNLRFSASAQQISNCIRVHSLLEEDQERKEAFEDLALTMTETAALLRGAARVSLFQAQLAGTLTKL